ncbi:MAG: hypothetical protein OER86_07610 [Phycisphaerae bacterium]|nr:hypothetical protein [Phycisphaerae bacterium]
MQHFKRPLIITGVAIAVALVLGIGAATWIYNSDISARKQHERAEMLGGGLGLTACLVAAPFWFAAAARVGRERREAHKAGSRSADTRD